MEYFGDTPKLHSFPMVERSSAVYLVDIPGTWMTPKSTSPP